MKTVVLFTLLLLTPLLSQAQIILQGQVLDGSGQPVVGANVYLKGLYEGASTDGAGAFSFTTKETGTQTLVVSFLGFSPLEQPVNLSQPVPAFRLTLKPDQRQLQTVTITAGAFEASDEKRGALLTSRDIVTTAGASADIMGAVNTLPGTQKVGEEGKLFVRGGDSYESKTFIDGLLVANPYNASVPDVPSRGRFSPFLFSGMAFSSGGFSAEYGQALSSALLLQSQGLAEESQTGFSLMSVGASLSRTKRWQNTSLAVSGEYTNLQPYMNLVPQRRAWRHMPETKAGSLVFRHKPSATGLIKLYGTYADSHLGLLQPNLDQPASPTPIDVRNRNLFLNSTYEETFQEKWTLQAGMAFTHTVDNLAAGDARVNTQENAWTGKAVLIRDLHHAVTLRTGLEVQLRGYRQQYRQRLEDDHRTAAVPEQNLAGFAEADVYLGDKLVARPGLRWERSTFLAQNALSPRLALAYQVSTHGQVSFAYGHFYQTPENDLLKYRQPLTFERAAHYILNYQRTANQRTLRVEGYYKDYRNLVRYNAPQLLQATEITNGGHGYARGVEIFWRDQKTVKGADYWVSYSLLGSKRLYKGYPVAARPGFASYPQREPGVQADDFPNQDLRGRHR
ncbi:TonB-dependent receptor domain-containing protein [Rufibacter glacialis]|uniref:TonB-dependent receptor domain-containing protein n=1 Tax=Rufibacter glacialis TaxID=1259555 RepID=A0A5M8QE56_9BACT|nr:TonB-dependent receptor [Rufibacter glacialis]KAA6433283.1 TonB-dependent receptor plug domain-containing protein [Rufibacter glacialis]GGK75883.1 TonB-dependent receptor [Rufibacter glacialis]